MGVYPTQYNKEDFIKFLRNNNVNEVIIAKFEKFPESIERNGNLYKIYINSIWYSIGNTFYNFELNYYSEPAIEFLFTCKPYGDIESCINNLQYEIKSLKCKNKK